MHRGPGALIPAPPCPGALDAAAAIVARWFPHLPLGATLIFANRLGLVPAIAMCVVALYRWSGSWIAAGAAGLAFASQPLLDPVASPFDPIVLLAAAAVMAIDPELRGRRLRLGVAAAAATMLATRWLAPALPSTFSGTPSCWFNAAIAGHWRGWIDGTRAALGSAGPYAMALAALGVYTLIVNRKPVRMLAALALIPALDSQPGQTIVRGFGPLLVAFWIAAACGLAELIAACRRSRAAIAAAALFTALLPVFQFAQNGAGRAAVETFGVDRLTADNVRALLAVLPDRSVIVDEDASFDLLLRSAAGASQRMGKRLSRTAASADAVAQAAADVRATVFALPRSQSRLRWEGIALQESGLPEVDGVARVTRAAACPRLRARWVSETALPASETRAMSIVTFSLGSEHAVIAYVVLPDEPHVSVIEPAGQERIGFHHDIYDAARPDDRARLDQIAGDDRLPAELLGRPSGFVTRIEIWRSAALPEVIAIDLGSRPEFIAIRSSTADSVESVCPVFAYTVRPITIGK